MKPNTENIKNSISNHLEDLNLTEEELIMKYYYMKDIYGKYQSLYYTNDDLQSDVLNAIVDAIRGFFKNQVYVRGSNSNPDIMNAISHLPIDIEDTYKKPTFVATQINGYVRSCMQKLIDKRETNIIDYMSDAAIEIKIRENKS